MHSQLNLIIANQHHAELIRAGDRARLVAQAKPGRKEGYVLTALGRFSGCITSLLTQEEAGAPLPS